MDKKTENINKITSELENKDFNIYYFTIDTKGNPNGGVANQYDHVKMLTELGYNAHILHDKEKYTSVEDWLGEDYSNLSHKPTKNLNVNPSDVIIVPEVFPTVMEQLSKFPCKKVVLSQSYSYIFELLGIGKSWNYDYGFDEVITTSEKQLNYIENHFPGIEGSIIEPVISDLFKKPKGDIKEPTVGIVARDQSDVLKIVKSFYLQYPMYKWITFKDMRGLSKAEFAEQTNNNCLSIWVDRISSFGTFPLESMKSNTPIIGVIPDMIPDWMLSNEVIDDGLVLEDNGIWTENILNIPSLISDYMKLWLEDTLPEIIFDKMAETSSNYTYDGQKNKLGEYYQEMTNKRIESFKNILKDEKNG